MSFDYINEAFKKLSLIEEELFNVNNSGMNDLADFVEDNNSSDNDVVCVIDPNASTDNDTDVSYVGKFVLRCYVCNSNILKSKDDVDVKDEIINPETVCPCCGESEGFKLIGIIAPFVEEESIESADEATTTDDVTDSTEEESTDTVEDNDDEESESIKSDSEIKESCSRATKFSSLLSEDFKEVKIVTDDQKMEMTSDDNGKVVITTEPIDADADTAEEDSVESEVEHKDVIVPPSEADIDSLIAEPEEVETTVDTSEEETEEQPSEDTQEQEPAEEPDTEEVDVDEIDEESFDDLGESFLREVYENVKSFKTTSVSSNDTTMVVEGMLTFNSGAEKKTGFVLNPSDMSKSGQIRFTGFNKHLSESKNSISLIGHVSDSKLIFESLRYNYTVDSTPVKGNVRRKRN